MNILLIGSGMMGRAIAYDLVNYSNFENITIIDKDRKTLKSAEKFLENKDISFVILNVEDRDSVRNIFQKYDVVISAVPYNYNYILAKIAIDKKIHFLDLGGNNTIIEKQKSLFKKAKENKVSVIPDCGLAPGLASIIVRDAVDFFDSVEYIKIRVGGLPQNPQPPFNYQIVFSPNGLINEYVEDAIVLDHNKIFKKKSMTELETISFQKPFGKMEAFLTSGGCSTLPYTFKNKIKYLDYKTIRYPGHCEKIKPLLDIGLASEKPIKINNHKIIPRTFLISLLLRNIPKTGKDVVLLKIMGEGIKNGRKTNLEYTMVDYYDKKNNITSMMRTTGYPISITAQMIENGLINNYGVFFSEEIIPCKPFFNELRKRNIFIKKEIK